jgi:hypothetical protein
MNKYDIFIDNLTKNFSGIKNFHLTQEEGAGKTLFDFVVKSFAELNSAKALFVNYYIPTAAKATSDDIKELNKSKYKSLINLSDLELKENYYETVRLGYVAVYHKYEIFIKQLLINAEAVYAEISNKNVTLENYIEKTFQFKILDIKYSPNLHRINYICNCTKHYDGFPRKTYPPKEFENLPQDKKLNFTADDLSKDIDFLITHYNSLLSTTLILGSHKMLHEGVLTDLKDIEDGPEKEKILAQKTIVDTNARQLIDSLSWT